MAVTKIKATYSLDVEAVEGLERLAKVWDVPKSEALRRAIAMAAERCAAGDSRATALLDEIQRCMGSGPVGSAKDLAERWLAESRAERMASARNREDRIGRCFTSTRAS
jgi:hypothetical protein